MPSKDMREILSRCRPGAAGAAAYKGIIAVAAIAVVSGIAAGVMVMNKPTPDPVEDNFAVADHEVLGIDDCEQVSNIFAYNPTTGDRTFQAESHCQLAVFHSGRQGLGRVQCETSNGKAGC